MFIYLKYPPGLGRKKKEAEEKTRKKSEKGVDKARGICYISQAVSERGAQRGEQLKKLKRERKKCLTNGSSSGRISELSEKSWSKGRQGVEKTSEKS